MFYMWWHTSVIQYKRIVNCLSLLFCCRDKNSDQKLLRGKREKDIRVAASALLPAANWAEGRVSCRVEFSRVKIIGGISSPEIGDGGSSGIGGFSLPAIGGFLWQAGKVVRFCFGPGLGLGLGVRSRSGCFPFDPFTIQRWLLENTQKHKSKQRGLYTAQVHALIDLLQEEAEREGSC